MNGNFKDMTGMRFGRLEVLRLAEGKHHGRAVWVCKCDCGKTVEVYGGYLRNGDTRSCGCLHDELARERGKTANKIHGGYYDRLHRIWTSMLDRCRNKNTEAYKNYGGRGIKVCEEWEKSYPAFKGWAYANGYDENAIRGECTLDRIDVNGDYCPENCRFISSAEQARNKRNTRNITVEGRTMCISEWARELEITPGAIQSAHRKYGVDEKAYILYRLNHKDVRYVRAEKVSAYAKEKGL